MALIKSSPNNNATATNPNEFGMQGIEGLTTSDREVLLRDHSCTQFKETLSQINGINFKKGEPIKKLANEFEEYCFSLLSFLLANDFNPLSINREERMLLLGDKVKRTDIEVLNACNPGAQGDSHTIWNTFKEEHNCKKLIFECKRYNKKISSKEIYQLFEYLHPSKIGKLGFIINLHGKEHVDVDGKNTLARIEDETDYKIIIIGKSDLTLWIDSFNKTGNSIQFLSDVYRASLGKIR